MIERFKRRLVSERGSIYLEYVLISFMTLGVAALLLDPSGMLFRGIGYDFAFREAIMKLPIF